METVSQIGEMYVTVEPKPKTGKHEVRCSIVTFEPNPRHDLDGYKLEGVWTQNENLNGTIEQLVDVADRVAYMFFTAFFHNKVSLYWEDAEMVKVETFHLDQTTTFEFAVVLDETDDPEEDTDE